MNYSKNLCKTATLKKTENWISRPIIAYAGQKYCRMLQREHSAIVLTFIKLPIKLPIVIKIFVLSIFEWQFYTGLLYLASTRGVSCLFEQI